MRKFAFAIVATNAMMFAGQAQATVAVAVANSLPSYYSPIEKVDCLLPSNVCSWGRHRVCKGMICSCVPCGGIWRLWHH